MISCKHCGGSGLVGKFEYCPKCNEVICDFALYMEPLDPNIKYEPEEVIADIGSQMARAFIEIGRLLRR